MVDLRQAIAQVRAGDDLSATQTSELIDQMLSGQTADQEIAELLLAMRTKGEAVSELIGAAQAMRRHMTPIPHRFERLLDTCGTGGSGSGTFNISTATAIVVAAAGVPVAKHGNRKATSRSGSADVLVELGVTLETDPAAVTEILQEIGLCFCFAPKLHPSMRYVMAVRRQLGVPTLFNLLGPLCNPAAATHQLLGVGNAVAQQKIAAAIQALSTSRTLVVHGSDGQDEVSLAGPTMVIDVRPQQSSQYQWTPDSFGLPTVTLDQLQADGPLSSAATIREVLAGALGPAREIVLANAAAALWLVGQAADVEAAARLAANTIDSGAAKDKLAQLATASRR